MALTDDADLAGGVIAAQTNTIQAGYVAESGATLLEFATPDETIAAVRNGEADAVWPTRTFDYDQADRGRGCGPPFVGETSRLAAASAWACARATRCATGSTR
jgi:hypothetical protein